MEHSKTSDIKVPKGYIANCYLVRFGIIFSNISIVSLVLFICSLITPVFLAILYALGIIIILATLGTIFVMIPNYWQILTSFMSNSSKLLVPLVSIIPYALGVGLIASIASIICLFFDKQKSHKGRIVFGIIVSVIIIIALIVVIAGGLR